MKQEFREMLGRAVYRVYREDLMLRSKMLRGVAERIVWDDMTPEGKEVWCKCGEAAVASFVSPLISAAKVFITTLAAEFPERQEVLSSVVETLKASIAEKIGEELE